MTVKIMGSRRCGEGIDVFKRARRRLEKERTKGMWEGRGFKRWTGKRKSRENECWETEVSEEGKGGLTPRYMTE